MKSLSATVCPVEVGRAKLGADAGDAGAHAVKNSRYETRLTISASAKVISTPTVCRRSRARRRAFAAPCITVSGLFDRRCSLQ